MIEHVGHEYYEEFFSCCGSALAENGLLVLQVCRILIKETSKPLNLTTWSKYYGVPWIPEAAIMCPTPTVVVRIYSPLKNEL
ncbi:hypothetical protein Dimus_029630 [Dionaea muscipula]